MLEIWKIVNGRERVDGKYLPSLPGQKLGSSKEAVRGRFSVDGCRVVVEHPASSIFWTLKASVGSAVAGRMHGRKVRAGVKREDGVCWQPRGALKKCPCAHSPVGFPRSLLSRLPSEMEYLDRCDPAPLPF